MNVLDINVLLALYRPRHSHHQAASRWMRDSLADGQPFTVPDLVWVGFVRLVTNRRVVPVPATFAQAWEFVESVLAQGSYLRFAGSPRTLAEFARLGVASNASVNLVTDAYIAACATSIGAAVVTFDRDFRKFDGLRIIEPA